MNRRSLICAATIVATLAGVTACSGDENNKVVETPSLRESMVNALDFPQTVFAGWEIVEAADRPSGDHPPVGLTAAPAESAGGGDASAQVSPEGCSATSGAGNALWKATHGNGQWAGAAGRKAEQSFRVDLFEKPAEDSLAAVEAYLRECATSTYLAGGSQVTVTTTVTDSTVLAYGLNEVKMFTTTATGAGPESTHSTLTAIATHEGQRLVAQFTTAGAIDGPAINIVGNWWSIVARKVVAG